MQVIIESDRDALVLPVAPDVSQVDVWGIVKDGLDGLWGGVDFRAEEVDNPTGGGLLAPGRVRTGGRYITVQFLHRANSSAVAEWEARDRIADMVGRQLTVTVDGPAGLRTIAGLIKSKPEFVHLNPWTCTCGVVVMCPDPLWRGLPVTVSGHWGDSTDGGLSYPLYDGKGTLEYSGGLPLNRLSVPNVGDRASWPILVVSGPASWLRFRCGTQVIELQHPVDSVRIDCRAGSAWSGGVDVTGFLTRDDFFQISPGGADVAFQASNPVRFSVEVAPAWL